MTAKEKAIYLFNKFDSFDFHDCADHKQSAKDGALIVVDEIISEILPFDTLLKYFYINVKEEINKI